MMNPESPVAQTGASDPHHIKYCGAGSLSANVNEDRVGGGSVRVRTRPRVSHTDTLEGALEVWGRGRLEGMAEYTCLDSRQALRPYQASGMAVSRWMKGEYGVVYHSRPHR